MFQIAVSYFPPLIFTKYFYACLVDVVSIYETPIHVTNVAVHSCVILRLQTSIKN